MISGHGMDPIPTSSLLAFWCAGTLADAEPWLWLAAVGLIGDMAEEAGFAEMAAARRFGVTALRDAAALVNAPRRSASGDASPALALLMAADGPKDVTAGDAAGGRCPARRPGGGEGGRWRRRAGSAPLVRGEVALIRFSSPTQIHPLIAQQWRGRLKDKIVLAANTATGRAGCTSPCARRRTATWWRSWPSTGRPGPTRCTGPATARPPAARCARRTGTAFVRGSASAPAPPCRSARGGDAA